MLDEGKVHADANASSQKRLDGRVAKFFALACGHGVAKGCVNYGVMQVRACMRQVRRRAGASTTARRAVGGRRHVARQVAPASHQARCSLGLALPLCSRWVVCLYPPEAFYCFGCIYAAEVWP